MSAWTRGIETGVSWSSRAFDASKRAGAVGLPTCSCSKSSSKSSLSESSTSSSGRLHLTSYFPLLTQIIRRSHEIPTARQHQLASPTTHITALSVCSSPKPRPAKQIADTVNTHRHHLRCTPIALCSCSSTLVHDTVVISENPTTLSHTSSLATRRPLVFGIDHRPVDFASITV